jgi:hypothetical protein
MSGYSSVWVPFLTFSLPAAVFMTPLFTGRNRIWAGLMATALGSLAWVLGAGARERGGIVASLE